MRAVQGETIEHVLVTFLTKDGRPLPAEGNATSRFADGRVIATHSFFRDISERLRAEELEERNAQLERERVARQLEKMAALGKLSAGLAHELNNPAAAAQRAGSQLVASAERRDRALAALHHLGLSAEQWARLDALASTASPAAAGSLRATEVSRLEAELEDWLEDHDIPDGWELAASLVHARIGTEDLDALAADLPAGSLSHVLTWVAESAATRDLASVVTRSAERISELVTAVKAYTFMDRAAEQIVDVHEGLENTAVILAHRLRDVTLRRDYGAGIPAVRAMGSGLNQVWTNLIDNAVDAVAGRDDGTITIRTSAGDGIAIVEIEDNGTGIPEEHLSRIFEPFFSTKPQGAGSGLGLDMVWRIVTEEHHGTVDVESAPGRTCFRVTLPGAG